MDTTTAAATNAPPEFILDVFADPRSVRDIVRAILHTIFFTRFFPAVHPSTRNVLDLVTLPYVDDDELATMIEQRAAALERQLDAERSSSHQTTAAAAGPAPRPPPHNTLARRRPPLPLPLPSQRAPRQAAPERRRKAWLSRGDEEVCWECWTVKVTVAEPRTESERNKVRRAMEQTLLTTAMKIVTFANTHKDHIPPITTQGGNPFPCKISIEQKESTGWASRMRIY
ncbi:hypothetical protein ARSEF1564_004097 [Beauveria bassiana]